MKISNKSDLHELIFPRKILNIMLSRDANENWIIIYYQLTKLDLENLF